METRTVEQVKSWKTRSFADGYAGLRELSDGDFSGAVRAGGAWLFMLNGRIIGVYEGSLDDFEDADGTAYAAPHPSLPLLFSMQERGGETQAKYYTNDTPLSEVDSTLTSGKFTGYIELSENVLSGDYYVAYYGGRSMSVAFVGASEQVVTGDDAFERANDEVGIYEVKDVSIEVTDVPEPEEPEDPEPSGGTDAGSGGASSAGASGAGGASKAGGESRTGGAGGTSETGTADSRGAGEKTGSGSESGAGASESSGGAGKAPTDTSTDSDASADGSPSTGVSTSTSTGTQPATDIPSATDAQSTDPAGRSGRDRSGRTDSAGSQSTGSHVEESEPTPDADSSPSADVRSGDPKAAEVETAGSETEPSAGDPQETETSPDASEQNPGTRAKEIRDSTTESDAETGGQEEGGAFADEEQWRETTTIPSLDPDRSEGPDGALADDSPESTADDGDASDSTPRASASKSAPSASESDSAPSRTSGTEKASGSGNASGGASGEASDEAKEKIRKLRSQLKQRKQQVEQLKSRLSDVESERNEYKRERDALRQEVERLEAKLENAGSAASASDKRQLDASQAFDGTNLFVRYESKGKATLDEAAEGKVEAGDVNANLRLEHHTQFEAENVEVAGEAFESFLTDSFEYRFVSWIIEELLYEMRDTGHRGSLKDLYESIPKIDRVDLHGSVSAGNADDTRQEAFDIIMRDRMGNPLVVADLNDSRDPTTGEMMGSLVDAASGVAQAHDELSGAFQVTESFFEPEALETTESATSGGFLSREKRESFVKLSRKRGYHLCLVESRSGGFHLNVPEL